LILHGELDMATVQDLQLRIDEVTVPGRAIVFDMAQLTFLGSTAITCMVRTSRATGHPVVLRSTPERVRRVLDIVDAPPQSLRAWVYEGDRASASC
jgi:anti-anti-sigma factor